MKIRLFFIRLLVSLRPLEFLLASVAVMGWKIVADGEGDEVTKITLSKADDED